MADITDCVSVCWVNWRSTACCSLSVLWDYICRLYRIDAICCYAIYIARSTVSVSVYVLGTCWAPKWQQFNSVQFDWQTDADQSNHVLQRHSFVPCGNYEWTVWVWWQCGLVSNYFDRSFTVLICMVCKDKMLPVVTDVPWSACLSVCLRVCWSLTTMRC